jgi:aminoglycoside phosphotransferase (APT) family kinase protein
MAVISVPPRPYDATAVRPGWADLPAELRAAVSARLGSRVVWAGTAGGGFTRGFAAVLQTVAGDRVFVKAASLVDQRHLSDWYAREVAITAALPSGLPVARPRWTLTAAGHFVVCLDAIEGRIPGLPWSRADLDATLTTYAMVADALRDPPAALAALGLARLADLARADLAWWGELAAGRETVPNLPSVARERLPELAALEARLPGYVESPSMIHGDLRVDNVLIDAAGRAWLCDWTWLCFGPAWFDLAGLLVTAYASGLPADDLFRRHPATRTAPDDGLDAALAALTGYWFVRAASPSTGSPHLRAHQRWSGEMALAWLAARQGWE